MEAVFGIPVVVLADPLEPPAQPRLTGKTLLAAARTADLIRLLLLTADNATDWHPIRKLLAAGSDRAGQLADLLAAEAGPVSPDAISAPSPIQRYFGVRGAALTVTQLAAAEATIAARGLSDLSTAPVALGDVVAELRALLAVVDDFRRFSLPCSKDVLDGPSPATGHGSAGTGLQRWIIGHHVYFMLNIRAAAMLRLALQALSRGDESATVSCINTAVMYARGFTAAMAHASAISPKCYQDQIRPTMAPPDTSVPLTGRMHKEHRAYRSALGQLLAALSEPYSALAERSPALAEAREVLLDADLVDIERHILLAGSLVGGEPSLVRNRTRDSAVSMLREMRTLRAAQYYPLVRSGDRAAAQSAAATHRRFATPEVAIKPVDGGVNGHNLEVSTPSP